MDVNFMYLEVGRRFSWLVRNEWKYILGRWGVGRDFSWLGWDGWFCFENYFGRMGLSESIFWVDGNAWTFFIGD